MHGIGQDGAGSRGAAMHGIEVFARLQQHPLRGNRGHPADCPALHDLARLLDDRVVAPVMPDQQGHARAFGGFGQLRGRLHGIGNRLLDKQMHATLDTRQPNRDMQYIGRGHDRRLRPDAVEHFAVIREIRNAKFSGIGFGLRRRIGNRRQTAGGLLADRLDVFAAEQADADDGNGDGGDGCHGQCRGKGTGAEQREMYPTKVGMIAGTRSDVRPPEGSRGRMQGNQGTTPRRHRNVPARRSDDNYPCHRSHNRR